MPHERTRIEKKTNVLLIFRSYLRAGLGKIEVNLSVGSREKWGIFVVETIDLWIGRGKAETSLPHSRHFLVLSPSHLDFIVDAFFGPIDNWDTMLFDIPCEKQAGVLLKLVSNF